MKKIRTILTAFLVLTCVAGKLHAQQNGSHGASQALTGGSDSAPHNPGHAHRPGSTGGRGAATASKAGYNVGISTASVIAATVAATVVTLVALLVADNGHTSH